MSPLGRVAFRIEPGITAAVHLAATRRALAERRPALRVYDLVGDVLSLGRYHLAPAGVAGLDVVRRHTGGRAAADGAGFIGVSLVLPHRAALVADHPLALAPEQAINRQVRGVLKGLEAIGVPAFYPGRDVLTVDRRPLALVSLEVDASGTSLFEAIVANTRDASRLPALLDVADPAGVVAAELFAEDAVVSLVRLGRATTTDAFAAAVRAGYAEVFGVSFEETPGPLPPPAGDTAAWVATRRLDPALDHRATARIQLGALDVRLAVADGAIRGALVTGDFIADSPAIAALEERLRGCPATPAAIAAVVAGVFDAPEHFILGIGPLATLVDTIVAALPR